MNAILNIETTQQWFEASKMRATQHLADAVNSWVNFCNEATAIQNSGAWRVDANTWSEFCRQTWDIDASRIRQFKGALPYATRIQNALENMPTPEAKIRKLKQAVSVDHPLMPQVYALGMEVASELEVAVQTSFFEHALTVLETEKTTGFVEVTNGVQMPGDFEDMRKWAVIKEIDEAKQRLRTRLLDKKRRIQGTARKLDHNTYIIQSDDPLPENFQFSFFVEATDDY